MRKLLLADRLRKKQQLKEKKAQEPSQILEYNSLRISIYESTAPSLNSTTNENDKPSIHSGATEPNSSLNHSQPEVNHVVVSMPDEDESLASSIPRQITYTTQIKLPSPSPVDNVIYAEMLASKPNQLQQMRNQGKRVGLSSIPCNLTVLSSFSYTLTEVDDADTIESDSASLSDDESSAAPQEYETRDDEVIISSLDHSEKQEHDAVSTDWSHGCLFNPASLMTEGTNALLSLITNTERDATNDTRSETDSYESYDGGCAPCISRVEAQ